MKKIIITTTYDKKLSYLNNRKVFKSWGSLYSDKTIPLYLKSICSGFYDVDGLGSFTYRPSGKAYKKITFTFK